MFEPSASLAEAVTCVTAPLAASSATVLASLSESVGLVTSDSSISVTAIVKVVEAWLLSALVALTVIVQDVSDS